MDKRRIVTRILMLLAVLALRAAQAAAQTPGCTLESQGHGTVYGTIQLAVTNAVPNDTIVCSPGAYTAGANLNKPLTLKGAQAGVDARDGRPGLPETILSAGAFVLGVADITIDGFTFQNLKHRTVDTYAEPDRFTMRNCILKGNVGNYSGGGIQFGGGPSLHANNFTFEQNLVLTTGGYTIYMGHSMDDGRIVNNLIRGDFAFGPFGARTGWVIEGNEFDGRHPTDGTPYWNFGINANLGDVLIQNNYVHEMYVGLGQLSVVGGTVRGNTFEDNAWAAFQLWGGEWGSVVSADATIENNLITYNGTACTGYGDASHGIRIRPNLIDATSIHLHYNSFVDLGVGTCGEAWAIRQQGTGDGDAEMNWWGTTDPAVIATMFGQGGVDFEPFITSYTNDPNPPYPNGFWPILKTDQTISVTTSAPQEAQFQTSFTVEASASSGLTVAITATGGCSALDAGNGSATVTITSSTVPCVVHYNQAGDDQYNAAAEVATSTAVMRADTVTLLTCPAGATYAGAPIEPCTAEVTGPGLAQPLAVTYVNNTNAGTAGASAAYPGTDDYNPSAADTTFVITKADTVTVVTCPTSAAYTGFPVTPCSGTVTGAGGLDQALTVHYTNNINPGTATATASYAETANYNSSSDTETFTIGDPDTPGSMHGDGYVESGDTKYHFNFRVTEGARKVPHSRFQLHVQPKRKPKPSEDKFEATAFTLIAFSDTPGVEPGKKRDPKVDTVLFAGTGEWKRTKGCTFEVRATDFGEPGKKSNETISITISCPDGPSGTSLSVSGELSGGNIQSMRVKR